MKKIILTVLVLTTLTLAACSANIPETESLTELAPVPAEYAGKTNPMGPEAAISGADLFNTNCSVCHGPLGHGDGPAGASLDPAPKNLPELSKVAEDDYLFWRISTGRQGTAMVGWKGVLTDKQIWQVIAYIHSLK